MKYIHKEALKSACHSVDLHKKLCYKTVGVNVIVQEIGENYRHVVETRNDVQNLLLVKNQLC